MAATTVNAPFFTTNILVNTLATRKVVFLPSASRSGPGKLYFIKDICGNCAASTIFISTVGSDTFDNKTRGSTAYAIMSTNFQSVLLMSDGLSNWYILQNYISNAVFSPSFFTPTSLTGSGLQLWLDATDTSTQTVSVNLDVSVWRDKSGIGNNTTATGTAGLIKQNANAINGRTALLFLNSYFTGGFVTANTGATAHAFCVATQNSSSGSAGRVLSLTRPGVADFNQTNTSMMFGRNGAQNLRIMRNNINTTVDLPGYATPFLAQSSQNGATQIIGLNGTLSPLTGNNGTAVNLNITQFGIGGTPADVNYWGGFIGEVIYYNTVLSTTNRQKVEGYLAWKWGIQSNLPYEHPFKYVPPRN